MPKLITVSIWTLSSLWDSTCASFIRPDLQLWTNYELPSTAKHLPAMRETRVRSLSREDPLEKEMATHSSTLAWRIPWTQEPGRLQFTGSQIVGCDWAISLYYIQKKRWCHLEQIIRDSAHTLNSCWKGKEKGLNLDKDVVIVTTGV